MSANYHILLEATIVHLEQLRSQGVNSVAVSSEVLTALASKHLPSVALPLAPRLTNNTLPSPALLSLSPTTSHPSPNSLNPTPPVKPLGSSSRWAKALDSNPPSAVSSDRISQIQSIVNKSAAFDNLRQQILSCILCPNLVSTRASVVVGTGSMEAKIMFIGEAPDLLDDRVGLPFGGEPGEMLTRILTAMGLNREAVFITHILKCRPDTQLGDSGNRKPKLDEIARCLPWLAAQVKIIQPQVIVALGSTATEALLNRSSVDLARLRGQWQDFEGIPVMPTFHPAYLIRAETITNKRLAWEDMLLVLEKAGYPTTSKQKGFFLQKS